MKRINILFQIILLLSLFVSASHAEIINENNLPSSLGWMISANPIGGYFTWEMPTTASHSIVMNGGMYDLSNYRKSYELVFMEHLGTQSTYSGWFYRGIGFGGCGKTFPQSDTIPFLSLLLGARYEFGSLNAFAELYSMFNEQGISPLLRTGLRIDADKFPFVPM